MAHTPSAIGARQPLATLLEHAHAAMARRDYDEARRTLDSVPGRDASAAMMQAHLALLEGHPDEARRWARLSIGRARSVQVRKRATDLLVRISGDTPGRREVRQETTRDGVP